MLKSKTLWGVTWVDEEQWRFQFFILFFNDNGFSINICKSGQSSFGWSLTIFVFAKAHFMFEYRQAPKRNKSCHKKIQESVSDIMN